MFIPLNKSVKRDIDGDICRFLLLYYLPFLCVVSASPFLVQEVYLHKNELLNHISKSPIEWNRYPEIPILYNDRGIEDLLISIPLDGAFENVI